MKRQINPIVFQNSSMSNPVSDELIKPNKNQQEKKTFESFDKNEINNEQIYKSDCLIKLYPPLELENQHLETSYEYKYNNSSPLAKQNRRVSFENVKNLNNSNVINQKNIVEKENHKQFQYYQEKNPSLWKIEVINPLLNGKYALEIDHEEFRKISTNQIPGTTQLFKLLVRALNGEEGVWYILKIPEVENYSNDESLEEPIEKRSNTKSSPNSHVNKLNSESNKKSKQTNNRSSSKSFITNETSLDQNKYITLHLFYNGEFTTLHFTFLLKWEDFEVIVSEESQSIKSSNENNINTNKIDRKTNNTEKQIDNIVKKDNQIKQSTQIFEDSKESFELMELDSIEHASSSVPNQNATIGYLKSIESNIISKYDELKDQVSSDIHNNINLLSSQIEENIIINNSRYEELKNEYKSTNEEFNDLKNENKSAFEELKNENTNISNELNKLKNDTNSKYQDFNNNIQNISEQIEENESQNNDRFIDLKNEMNNNVQNNISQISLQIETMMRSFEGMISNLENNIHYKINEMEDRIQHLENHMNSSTNDIVQNLKDKAKDELKEEIDIYIENYTKTQNTNTKKVLWLLQKAQSDIQFQKDEILSLSNEIDATQEELTSQTMRLKHVNESIDSIQKEKKSNINHILEEIKNLKKSQEAILSENESLKIFLKSNIEKTVKKTLNSLATKIKKDSNFENSQPSVGETFSSLREPNESIFDNSTNQKTYAQSYQSPKYDENRTHSPFRSNEYYSKNNSEISEDLHQQPSIPKLTLPGSSQKSSQYAEQYRNGLIAKKSNASRM